MLGSSPRLTGTGWLHRGQTGTLASWGEEGLVSGHWTPAGGQYLGVRLSTLVLVVRLVVLTERQTDSHRSDM